MKMISVLVVSLISFAATAGPQPYYVTSKLLLNEKVMSSPKIAVLPGETSKIAQESHDTKTHLSFRVLSEPKNAEFVSLRTELMRMNKDKSIIKSESNAYAKMGEEIISTINDEKGNTWTLISVVTSTSVN